MRRKCVLAPFHDLMSDLVGQLCLSAPTAFVEKTQPPTTPLVPAMMAAPEYSFLSSSGVKEIATFGGDLTGLVPAPVASRLQEALKR